MGEKGIQMPPRRRALRWLGQAGEWQGDLIGGDEDCGAEQRSLAEGDARLDLRRRAVDRAGGGAEAEMDRRSTDLHRAAACRAMDHFAINRLHQPLTWRIVMMM